MANQRRKHNEGKPEEKVKTTNVTHKAQSQPEAELAKPNNYNQRQIPKKSTSRKKNASSTKSEIPRAALKRLNISFFADGGEVHPYYDV
jgi:hypothetical protein